jgi:hypothetical protein
LPNPLTYEKVWSVSVGVANQDCAAPLMYTVHVLGGVHATEKCIHVLSVHVAGVTEAKVPHTPNMIVFVESWLTRPVLETSEALPKSNTRDPAEWITRQHGVSVARKLARAGKRAGRQRYPFRGTHSC